ncbi:unnamed protein product [Prunus armeniaca]
MMWQASVRISEIREGFIEPAVNAMATQFIDVNFTKIDVDELSEVVHPFCFCSCDGRVKFPTDLEIIDWSTSQLSLVCERATASLENPSRLL